MMSDGLRECPSCRHARIEIIAVNRTQVACPACGMAGPSAPGVDKAARAAAQAAWNALPRQAEIDALRGQLAEADAAPAVAEDGAQ